MDLAMSQIQNNPVLVKVKSKKDHSAEEAQQLVEDVKMLFIRVAQVDKITKSKISRSVKI